MQKHLASQNWPCGVLTVLLFPVMHVFGTGGRVRGLDVRTFSTRYKTCSADIRVIRVLGVSLVCLSQEGQDGKIPEICLEKAWQRPVWHGLAGRVSCSPGFS